MDNVIDFAAAKQRLRSNARSFDAPEVPGIRKHHQLKVEYVERRQRVAATCSCGEEFKRWAPEEGRPEDTMEQVRHLYRVHLRGLHAEAVAE